MTWLSRCVISTAGSDGSGVPDKSHCLPWLLHPFKGVFLNLATINILGQLILCSRGRAFPVHCRIFNSLAGPYALHASNTLPPTPSCDNQRSFQILLNVLWGWGGQNHPCLRTTDVWEEFNFHHHAGAEYLLCANSYRVGMRFTPVDKIITVVANMQL